MFLCLDVCFCVTVRVRLCLSVHVVCQSMCRYVHVCVSVCIYVCLCLFASICLCPSACVCLCSIVPVCASFYRYGRIFFRLYLFVSFLCLYVTDFDCISLYPSISLCIRLCLPLPFVSVYVCLYVYAYTYFSDSVQHSLCPPRNLFILIYICKGTTVYSTRKCFVEYQQEGSLYKKKIQC